jgi:hypothetical protein
VLNPLVWLSMSCLSLSCRTRPVSPSFTRAHRVSSDVSLTVFRGLVEPPLTTSPSFLVSFFPTL